MDEVERAHLIEQAWSVIGDDLPHSIGLLIDAGWRPKPRGDAVEQATRAMAGHFCTGLRSPIPGSVIERYRAFARVLAEAGLLRTTACDDPIECGHEAALGEAEAKLEHLQTELAGMSDMATRTRDHRQQQFDALHRAIGEAVGYDPDAPWPGNAKAAEDLRALRDAHADLEALFELQWKRSRQAEALWRAEDPERRRNVGPDLGVLLEWLIKRGDEAEEKLREVLSIVRTLVDLKDGPRDEHYRDVKDAAWSRARVALGEVTDGE